MNRKTVLAIILTLAMLIPLIPVGIIHATDTECVQTTTGTGEACFEFSRADDAEVYPTSFERFPPNRQCFFPHGLFELLAFWDPNHVATEVITMTFPANLPPGTRWMGLQLIDRSTDKWKWVDFTSLLSSNDGDNVLVLTITDDGQGDIESSYPGIILHFGAPCLPASRPQDLDQSTGITDSVHNLRAPNLHNNIISINPSQTMVNQPVTITTNVVNEGSMEGSTRLALKINGRVEQTQVVNVGPGGSRPVKFTVTKAEPGTYTVIIGNQRASFLVSEDTAGSTNIDGGVIAIMLLVLLAAAVVLVLAFSFGRKPKY